MSNKLNDNQIKAVEASGMNVLVSASAGTGKTSTMCQRILRHILDGERPLSLDRMLIVTFTTASAADMRRKMTEALKEELKACEEDSARKQRILSQLRLLPSARICTIDSYCSELVRSRFDVLGISPRMRVPGEAEIARLRAQSMSAAMETVSSGERAASFAELSDSLLFGYLDNDLTDVFTGLYEQINCTVEGISLLKDAALREREAAKVSYADLAEKPSKEPSPARLFYLENLEALSFFTEEYRRFLPDLEKRTQELRREGREALNASARRSASVKADNKQAAIDLLTVELAAAEKAKELLTDPRALKDHLKSVSFGRLSSQRDLPSYHRFRYARTLFKAFCTDRKRSHTDFEYEKRRETLTKEAEMLDTLYELLSVYEKKLTERKQSAGLVEFSDVERYALKLLVKDVRTGEKTELAGTLGAEFDEIYVDEYQDVNDVQNAIFCALSDRNRFMVGDVKQSIYGFRNARPEIFNALRESYPPAEEKKDGGKVFFRENYRCSLGVVRFVNRVCGRVLDCCSDMSYFPDDDLIYRKSDDGAADLLPEICLVTGDPAFIDRNEVENAEATYTARSIRALIDSGVKPEDIAILVSRMTIAPPLRRAMDKEGIPLNLNCRKGYFKQPEVLLLRSLVEIIDNPTKDVFLMGAMKSPIFGFTLDELWAVKRENRSASLYSSLTEYARKTGDPRALEVLGFIARMRRRSREWTADKLVYEVMSETKLIPRLTLGATPGRASQIRDDLLYFYDLLRVLSDECQGQIGRALSRIADMEERDDAGDGKSAEPVKGQVQMMTVHGSKGLEFKYCWLYGCASSGRSGASSLHFSKSYGVDLRVPDDSNPQFRRRSEYAAANVLEEEKKLMSEKYRLLYVALTRAKERLFISGFVSGDKRETFAALGEYRNGQKYPARTCRDFLSMIYYGLGGQTDLCREHVDEYPVPFGTREKETPETESVADLGKTAETFRERLEFSYPHRAAVDLPAKTAVSRLYPSMLDEEDADAELLPDRFAFLPEEPDGEDEPEEEEKTDAPKARKTPPTPRFISEEGGAVLPASPAERGTATHAFMQFVRLNELEKPDGFRTELKRLLDERFIDQRTADLVEEKLVAGFINSDLYARMKKGSEVRREQRFMIALPAADFLLDTPENREKRDQLKDEELLVQGVIDCFFTDGDGKTVLFDYKTDSFGKKARTDPAYCEKILLKRHTQQLSYYCRAFEMMTMKKVDECLIYSFALGRAVKVPVDNAPSPIRGAQNGKGASDE